MAFWGVEVKPGKPITHSCEKARGRLRISQATLAIGNATKKSVVQCNVGNRSPVLLSVLLPEKTESCHLDLEFAEADDVVFSVIGPRSVYLTGYYVHQSQQTNANSDSESFGVDIENTQSEGYSNGSDDDKYEDSFIDDGEIQVSQSSHVSSSRETDETTSENDKLKDKKGHGTRLKKKYQVSGSENDDNLHESEEDEDGYLLSVFNSKRAAKKAMSNDGGKNGHLTSKDDGVCANKPEEKVDPLDVNGKPESAKPKKKRKRSSNNKDKTCKVESDKVHNVLREDIWDEVEAPTNRENGSSMVPLSTPESGSKGQKSKKRKKDDKVDGTVNDLPAANQENQEQQIDNHIVVKDELHANDGQPEKKTKKKKKKTEGEGDLNMDSHNMTDNEETAFMKIDDQTTSSIPNQKRTLSNGLVIEHLADGPSDGKVAVPGKKVKIYYTAMLMDNGKVLDSNVGKSACKFRLGDEEFMSGWNVGIEGMRVGDKRRLIIPPSMCSGNYGGGENVPPNSWLVYDVELASVRR